MLLLETKHKHVLNALKVAKEQAHVAADAARQADSNAAQALAEAAAARDQLQREAKSYICCNSEPPATSRRSPLPRSGLGRQSPAAATSAGGTKKISGDSTSTSASAQLSLAPTVRVVTTPKAQTQHKFLRNQWPESHKYFSAYVVFEGIPCSVVISNSSALILVLVRVGTTKSGPHPPPSCPLAAVNCHGRKHSVQPVPIMSTTRQSDMFNLDESFASSASMQDLPVPPDVAKVSELRRVLLLVR